MPVDVGFDQFRTGEGMAAGDAVNVSSVNPNERKGSRCENDGVDHF